MLIPQQQQLGSPFLQVVVLSLFLSLRVCVCVWCGCCRNESSGKCTASFFVGDRGGSLLELLAVQTRLSLSLKARRCTHSPVCMRCDGAITTASPLSSIQLNARSCLQYRFCASLRAAQCMHCKLTCTLDAHEPLKHRVRATQKPRQHPKTEREISC